TVKRDVPLPVTLEQLTDGGDAGKRDPARQRAQYERFGFKTWLKEVEAVPLVGLACLGTAEDPLRARLVGMAFAFGDEALYLPLAHQYPAAPAQMPIDTAL